MLTARQRDLLLFINRHLAERGIAPSFDEMRAGIGMQSKSGIHRLLAGLQRRGFIRRLHNRARAIEVLRTMPEAATPRDAPPAYIVEAGEVTLMNGRKVRGIVVEYPLGRPPDDVLDALIHRRGVVVSEVVR